MVTLALFGAGRIGKIHAGNIQRSGRAALKYVVDVDRKAAKALAAATGASVADADAVFADKAVDAVLVCSSTDTHASLVEAACRAKKAVFCEKPVDLDSARVRQVVKAVKKAGVPFFVAFNRRFDPSFAALHKALSEGRIGKVEQVIITSRDPGPPPASYVKVSGGLFRDMMIHDLDMARWMLGEEPTEVYAVGSCLVDRAIGKAGDVDTAAVTLKTKSGAICQITNSRRAVYGYDQRIEVFGAGGMLRAANRTETSLEVSDGKGVTSDKPMFFFLERYAEAYRHELNHFLDCLEKGAKPLTGADDGLRSLLLADAATESVKTGRPVAV